MDVILVPGLWLDASSWDRVAPVIERAGHRVHPLTLPGMESRDADRSAITLRDHVDAVIAAIDAVDPAAGKVALVGHSAGSGIAYAALDARPDRVACAVLIGGFPTGDGGALCDAHAVVNGEIPLPDWSAFEEEDLVGLDDKARAEFRERAIPSPEQVPPGPQRLADERRYDVPVTVVATEFSTEALKGWIAKGAEPVREFTKIRDVRYVDLPTGHWPQFTRPEELAWIILGSMHVQASAVILDDHGRPQPPVAAGEVASVLGFLDYQRATLAWKCAGLDAAGFNTRVAASSMTLGGMLNHMTLVEESWFSRSLHGHESQPPWSTVDWKATPDWEWDSAAEDTPEQLRARWQDAVARSRELVAEALADGGLDRLAKRAWPDGMVPSLRWILLHMIEEYARHNGHADLIREAIDGETGE
jgi:pimeloyl-ACP methyl ester carboxylesterase/uncharacterized damage-inducible protein DinB